MRIKIAPLGIVAFVALILASCGTDRMNSGKVIPMDFSQQSVSVHEIGLIRDVEIYNLNADMDEALFGEINKLIRHNNRLYLADYRKTMSVFVYDTSGAYINTISAYGQGPAEYYQLTDIFVDPIDHTLNLVSRIDRKLLKYDADGQQLLSISRLPKAFSCFTKTADGFIGDMRNYTEDMRNPQNLWILSKDLEPVNAFFDIDPSWESISSSTTAFSSTYKSKTYYTRFMDPNIYTVEDDDIYVSYTFDLGQTTLPEEYRSFEAYEELRDEFKHMNYVYNFYNFQETDNFLIVQTVYKGQVLFGIYNKQDGQSKIARTDANTDKYLLSFGQIVGMDETAIYTLVEAEDVKRMWDGKDKYNDYEAKYPEQIKRLREKFNHIDENGNPFLLIYSIH